jgi:hypothetical protein
LIRAVHLDVGPLRFALRTAERGAVRYADPAYAGFFSAPAGAAPLAEMPVDVVRGAVVRRRASRCGGRGTIGRSGGWCGIGFPRRFAGARVRAAVLPRRARFVARGSHAAGFRLADGVCEAPLRLSAGPSFDLGLLARIGAARCCTRGGGEGRAGLGVHGPQRGAGKSTISALLRDAAGAS